MNILMESIRLRLPLPWQVKTEINTMSSFPQLPLSTSATRGLPIDQEIARLRAEVINLQNEVSRLRAQLAIPLPGCLNLQDRFLPAARRLVERAARKDAPDGEIEEVEYGGERYLVVLDWPDNDEHLGPTWPVCTGILSLTWLAPEGELDSDWVDEMTGKAIDAAKDRSRA